MHGALALAGLQQGPRSFCLWSLPEHSLFVFVALCPTALALRVFALCSLLSAVCVHACLGLLGVRKHPPPRPPWQNRPKALPKRWVGRVGKRGKRAWRTGLGLGCKLQRAPSRWPRCQPASLPVLPPWHCFNTLTRGGGPERGSTQYCSLWHCGRPRFVYQTYSTV